jgi:hypothetical protein
MDKHINILFLMFTKILKEVLKKKFTTKFKNFQKIDEVVCSYKNKI